MVSRCIYAASVMFLFSFGQSEWVETTQGDFADGQFERNIYASHAAGGAVEFAPRFDLNNDGYIDLFTADRSGPYVRIYWGSAGGYSAGNVQLFNSSGGANCDAADLNCDGYPEFLVAHYLEKISIYWGTAGGPDPMNYTDLPMTAWNRKGIFSADFDKDGYLDIATTQGIDPDHGAVYWGSDTGYSVSDRIDLPCTFGNHNIEVADLNLDNWLDILFVEYAGGYAGQISIYWGSVSGFIPSAVTILPGLIGNSGVSVADLNGDGYLDLIGTGWYDPRSYIYWGTAGGYSVANMQVLSPGYCYGGSSVADLDGDSYLDIVYHHGGYGVDYQKVYWGSVSGYSNGNYSDLGIPLETSGGLVADFNGDGHLDVFCNTRTPGWESHVFYGPSHTTSQTLPVYQDHHAMFREIGNVYDREYYEDYLSSVFDAGALTDWGTVEWDAATPGQSSVLLWIRTGSTAVPDSTWSNWETVSNGGHIPDFLNAQYLQYRARLCYDNPCFLPALREVSIGYGTSTAILASVAIKPRTINLGSHGIFTAFITLPTGYCHTDIDRSTVMCEGANAVWGHATPPFYTAKFNVQDLVGVVAGSSVTFTVSGELSDGTEFLGYDTVRVVDHVDGEQVECRPNPVLTEATISFSNIADEKVAVKIYDVKGALVRSFDGVECMGGYGGIMWDRHDNRGRRMPSGIYLFIIEGKSTRLAEKIIVMD
ncbi:MAG: T9SS type A sorting domain-containing protein [candidate division WOR-3 bacterium]|nr:MAG: T9SS type A sorting domain-containing protein [candidate division WOR-3 bacterium]